MQDVLTRKVWRAFAAAFAVAAVAVPAAQANPRPLAGLERFYQTSKTQSASRPIYGVGDNMSFYNQKHATKTAKTIQATRPDDRAGIRGVGATQLAVVATLNDTSDVVSRFMSRLQHVRPDDRSGILGIGSWEKRLVLR
jgi:hypothetical protein